MKRWYLLIGTLVVLLSACGSAQSTAPTSGAEAAAPAYNQDAAAAADTEAGSAPGAEQAAPAAEQAAQGEQAALFDRLVIHTATQRMLVDNVDSTEQRIRQIAAERGGYVLSSEASGEADARRATMVIKVPAERFDDTLAALTGLAQKVESQQIKGQDVTDEYVDLQSRLRNLKVLEARLLQFLDEAATIEDSLRVSDQLARTQGEIEQVQGRITYLDKSAQYATITASLHSIPAIAIAPDAGWSPMRIVREALQGVVAFGQAIVTLVIVVAVWVPVWGPLALAGLWFWRRTHRVPASPA